MERVSMPGTVKAMMAVVIMVFSGCASVYPSKHDIARMKTMLSSVRQKVQSTSMGDLSGNWLAVPGTRGGTWIPILLGWYGYGAFCAAEGSYVADVWKRPVLYGRYDGKVFVFSSGPDGDWRTASDNVPSDDIFPGLARFLEKEVPELVRCQKRCDELFGKRGDRNLSAH